MFYDTFYWTIRLKIFFSLHAVISRAWFIQVLQSLQHLHVTFCHNLLQRGFYDPNVTNAFIRAHSVPQQDSSPLIHSGFHEHRSFLAILQGEVHVSCWHAAMPLPAYSTNFHYLQPLQCHGPLLSLCLARITISKVRRSCREQLWHKQHTFSSLTFTVLM